MEPARTPDTDVSPAHEAHEPVEVTLTPAELRMGCVVGLERQLEAIRKGLTDKHGFDGDTGWSVHIEGALGELAVAKALARYFPGTVNSFTRGGDVGDLQVRTRSRHDYELLVRPGDRDADVFILVTGRAPRYRVWGWITGAGAKRAEWCQAHGNRPPAYFVPHAALKPLRRGP